MKKGAGRDRAARVLLANRIRDLRARASEFRRRADAERGYAELARAPDAAAEHSGNAERLEALARDVDLQASGLARGGVRSGGKKRE
jgi:hypothetical protein